MYFGITGIVLSLIATGLIIYYKKQQQISNNLTDGDVQHLQDALLVLQKEFTQYQVDVSRKNKEIEDIITIKTKEQEKNLIKLNKDLPLVIRNVIGHIEFAKPLDKK